MNKKINIITKIGIVAALYVTFTLAIAPMSYGAIQFRLSEVMTLLAFVDPLYIPGLVLGCVISNLFSPFGIIDVIVGSTATFISVYMISKSKSLFVASLWPTINCIFVGGEAYYLSKLPFLLTTLQVAIGEFVVVTIIGYPLFRLLIKNKNITKALRLTQ